VNYTKVDLRNKALLDKVREIKAEHPFWGYRRVSNSLRYQHGLPVNKKRIERLMRKNSLQVKPNLRLKACRTPLKAKPRATRPNEWWGIDMTKVLITTFGWVYVVIVLDWYTKKIVGHYAGLQSKTEHWLAALDMAVNRQFHDGARGHDLHLMSDNGCQPTSKRFMETCARLGINQAFTSYNNPKGNADTERMNRTIKEELVWLREWGSPLQFFKELDTWVEHKYNATYPHSMLGGKPPNVFELNYFNSRIASSSPAV
jgi:transposase InsO family protein